MSYPQSVSSSQGFPSVMAPRRKNIPCDGLTGNQEWKISTPSSDHSLVPVSQGPYQGLVSPRNSTCKGDLDHRTYSNDRSQVRRWAAASATGSQSPTNNSFHLVPGSSQSYDISNSGLTLPHHASTMQSTISELSLSNQGRTFDFPHQDIMCTTSAGDTLAMPTCATTFPLDPDFNDYGFSTEEIDYNAWARAEAQSYNIPDSVEMMYSTSAEFHQEISINHGEDPRLHTLWIDEQPLRQGRNQGGVLPYSSGQMPLSPLSAVPMDPSVSSYSQNSFYPAYNGSPISSTTQEELPCLDPTGIVDDDYSLSTLKLEGTFHLPMSYHQYDAQSDVTKTLKPHQGFQRMPLSNVPTWPSSEPSSQQTMTVPYGDGFMHRRLSGDGDMSTARHNELYQVGPQEDGLYHCPFEITEGCTHKAEKLKCNYDKHLDSHLKPYRCKVYSCVSVPFSSTACLLRHEREAHGMHGHGEKPYLCTYEDCDRSTVGNGFPRRWNLQDHMKRVHDYTAPPSSTGSTSPTPSSVSSQHHGKAALPMRKRRTSNNSQPPAPKRTKSLAGGNISSKASKSSLASNSQGKQRQTMQKKWREQHAALKDRLEALDPTDAMGHEQIGADYEILQCIGAKIRSIEAGQLANNS